MRSWDDYKETIKSSEDLFTQARSGELTKTQEYMLSHPGVDINQKNHKGYSPLMLSVYHGHFEVSELLLNHGADPDSADLSGNTILMGAAFKGDEEIIKLLIRHGARKDLINNNGMTASEWASAFGRQNALAILQPEAKNSLLQTAINFTKILRGMTKSHNGKEAAA